MGAQRAGAPVLTGSVPPLAPFYHARQETGSGLADALRPGARRSCSSPRCSGLAGRARPQLAVGFAHAMWSARAVDLLAWVPAGNRSAIIAGYARAAADLDLLAGGGAVRRPRPTAPPQRFLDWLRTTERRWAVVLDGVASPVDLDGLWPRGPAGQVVVTSRLRESELAWSGANVTAHAVAGFSRREALGYLNARLAGFPDQRIEALDLAEDLGGLPIALAQAAAVVIVAESTCRDYRAEYAQRLRTTTRDARRRLPAVAARHLVARRRARPRAAARRPVLARAGLRLGPRHQRDPGRGPHLPRRVRLHHGAHWRHRAHCPHRKHGLRRKHGRRPGGRRRQPRAVRLRRPASGSACSAWTRATRVRTVWLHTAVRAAVRAYLAPGNVEQVAAAAATALLEAWPDPGAPGSGPQLSQALRDCAAALRAFAGDLLWKPEAHPVLLRAGTSLTEAPALTDAAIAYWQALSAASGQLLGYGHAQSVLARDRLADAFASSERLAEALARLRGGARRPRGDLRPAAPGDGHRTAERGQVAERGRAGARGDRAVRAGARGAGADRAGPGTGRRSRCGYSSPPRTRRRAGAATASGCTSGRSSDAERELGPTHRDTLSARVSLAGAYLAAGQAREAIAAFQRALADHERTAGADDPATLATRASLAGAYRAAGKTKDAIAAASGCSPTGSGCSARTTPTRSPRAAASATPTAAPGG